MDSWPNYHNFHFDTNTMSTLSNTDIQDPATILFQSLCKVIWRKSFSSGWVKRSDNTSIIRVLEETNGSIALIANQLHGHKYVCLNSSVNHTLPKPIVNKKDKCAVHIFLHDHASWKNLKRQFILCFDVEEGARKFVEVLNHLMDEQMHHRMVVAGELFHPNATEEIEEDDEIDDENEVGICPKCNHYGLIKFKCLCMNGGVTRITEDCTSNDTDDINSEDDEEDDGYDEDEEDELPMTQPFPEPPILMY